MSGWALKEAEESCTTVFERALAGEPQFIMRGRKPALLVVSVQFDGSSRNPPRKTVVQKRRPRTLFDALRSCPCGDDLAALIPDRTSYPPSYFERTGGFDEEHR